MHNDVLYHMLHRSMITIMRRCEPKFCSEFALLCPGLLFRFPAESLRSMARIGQQFHFITRLCQWLHSCPPSPWPSNGQISPPQHLPPTPTLLSNLLSILQPKRPRTRCTRFEGGEGRSCPTQPAERMSGWLGTARAWGGEGFGRRGLELARA